MTRDSLPQRKVVDQLIEDAARYASMKHVDTLVCLVYDPGNHCHNPTALERDVRRVRTNAVGPRRRLPQRRCEHHEPSTSGEKLKDCGYPR